MTSKMYKDTETWNPFIGCRYECVYCKNSFQRQAKRQKNNCIKCYNYEPHFHPERLKRLPSKRIPLIFACAYGDITFATRDEKQVIIDEMAKRSDRTFLFQSKNPVCLKGFSIPSNVIVGTTIETNRDTKHVSKAPKTEFRYSSLKDLVCRKAVTIEPILDFDMDVLKQWVLDINPEIVWIGYANHNKGLNLVEPSLEKTHLLIKHLKENIDDVRLKTIIDKMR